MSNKTWYCTRLACYSMLSHAPHKGDEHNTFNSHKYTVAVMPFPLFALSSLRSNFNKAIAS